MPGLFLDAAYESSTPGPVTTLTGPAPQSHSVVEPRTSGYAHRPVWTQPTEPARCQLLLVREAIYIGPRTTVRRLGVRVPSSLDNPLLRFPEHHRGATTSARAPRRERAS